jgi:hypothetical protein
VLQRNVEQAAKGKKKQASAGLIQAFSTVSGENETRVLWKPGANIVVPLPEADIQSIGYGV